MSKILILGAGASNGHGVRTSLAPPLASNLFHEEIMTTLQEPYSNLFQYLRSELGLNLEKERNIDIEDLFGKVEWHWNREYNDFDEAVSRFGIAIATLTPINLLSGYMIDVVHNTSKWLKKRTCPFHRKIFSEWLEPGDTIISFNYDLIIDVSLKRHGRWNEKNGYGFTRYDEVAYPEPDILLLKPHGSLNWFLDDKPEIHHGVFNEPRSVEDSSSQEIKKVIHILNLEDALNGRSLQKSEKDSVIGAVAKTAQALNEATIDQLKVWRGFLIGAKTAHEGMSLPIYMNIGFLPFFVFPTPFKSPERLLFSQLNLVWRQIRKKLEDASNVVAVGFSFRDEHFNSVLRESLLGRSRPLNLKIVNPDLSINQRVFAELPSREIHVEQLPYLFGDYVNSLS